MTLVFGTVVESVHRPSTHSFCLVLGGADRSRQRLRESKSASTLQKDKGDVFRWENTHPFR